jgi:hypothetical protein
MNVRLSYLPAVLFFGLLAIHSSAIGEEFIAQVDGGSNREETTTRLDPLVVVAGSEIDHWINCDDCIKKPGGSFKNNGGYVAADSAGKKTFEESDGNDVNDDDAKRALDLSELGAQGHPLTPHQDTKTEGNQPDGQPNTIKSDLTAAKSTKDAERDPALTRLNDMNKSNGTADQMKVATALQEACWEAFKNERNGYCKVSKCSVEHETQKRKGTCVLGPADPNDSLAQPLVDNMPIFTATITYENKKPVLHCKYDQALCACNFKVKTP